MKKLISILAIFCFTFSFSQIKVDLSKKQAYERFKNSNVRKACGIKLKEFENIWNSAPLQDNGIKKISEMFIFKNTTKENLKRIKNCYKISPYKCTDCKTIIYFSKKEDIDSYGANAETY